MDRYLNHPLRKKHEGVIEAVYREDNAKFQQQLEAAVRRVLGLSAKAKIKPDILKKAIANLPQQTRECIRKPLASSCQAKQAKLRARQVTEAGYWEEMPSDGKEWCNTCHEEGFVAVLEPKRLMTDNPKVLVADCPNCDRNFGLTDPEPCNLGSECPHGTQKLPPEGDDRWVYHWRRDNSIQRAFKHPKDRIVPEHNVRVVDTTVNKQWFIDKGTAIETESDRKYYPKCSCGWRGQPRKSIHGGWVAAFNHAKIPWREQSHVVATDNVQDWKKSIKEAYSADWEGPILTVLTGCIHGQKVDKRDGVLTSHQCQAVVPKGLHKSDKHFVICMCDCHLFDENKRGALQWRCGRTFSKKDCGNIAIAPDISLASWFDQGAKYKWPEDPDRPRLCGDCYTEWRINNTLEVEIGNDWFYSYHRRDTDPHRLLRISVHDAATRKEEEDTQYVAIVQACIAAGYDAVPMDKMPRENQAALVYEEVTDELGGLMLF
jgi:hypothetical protein